MKRIVYKSVPFGNYFYDGGDGGVYDAYDDIMLAEAFDLHVNPAKVIRDEFSDQCLYNEQSLIDAGILGAPVHEGGLINGAQLQRLHNGAIRQLGRQVKELTEQNVALTAQLAQIENKA
jgi:hypothetical protein